MALPPYSHLAKLETELETVTPVLTSDSVMKVVLDVKNLERLYYGLHGSHKSWEEIDSLCEDKLKLKAIVESWLSDDRQPLWRRVIYALDEAGETNKADCIINYAEPLLDRTLTVDNVMFVMNAVGPCEYTGEKFVIPDARMAVIKQQNSSPLEQAFAIGNYWVNAGLSPSWKNLTDIFYFLERSGGMEAVMKHYLRQNRDPSLRTEVVMHNLQSAGLMEILEEAEKWKKLAQELNIPLSKLNEMQDLGEAIDYWVHTHPCPSWLDVIGALKKISKSEVAESHQEKYSKARKLSNQVYQEAKESGFQQYPFSIAFFRTLACLAAKGRICSLCLMLRGAPPEIVTSSMRPCTRPTADSDEPTRSGQDNYLLVFFPDGGPRLGMFCLLIDFLLKNAKWKVLLRDRAPVDHYHNRITFCLPGGMPGRVTISDSFSSFFMLSVSIAKFLTDKLPELCCQIRATILDGIQHVFKVLQCTNSLPVDAFFCSVQDCESSSPHPATIINKFLVCTINPELALACDEEKLIWFPTSGSSSENPNMKELINFQGKNQRINIAEEIGDCYYPVGMKLLNGHKLAVITKKCHGDPLEISREILRCWVERGGMEDRSWQGLINVLRESHVSRLVSLADTIEEVKGK